MTCSVAGCVEDSRHSVHGWFTLWIADSDTLNEVEASLPFCDEHYDVVADDLYEGLWKLT